MKIFLTRKLANNFSSFLEKIFTLLERLVDQMPQYDVITDMIDRFGQPYFISHVQKHIEDIYHDLFQIFQEMSHVFTSRGSKLSYLITTVTLAKQEQESSGPQELLAICCGSHLIKDLRHYVLESRTKGISYNSSSCSRKRS